MGTSGTPGTPLSFDVGGTQPGGTQPGDSQRGLFYGHAMSLTAQAAHTIWQYAGSVIDAKECARRLTSSTCGTIGGIAISHGVTALATRAGQSFHPVAGFFCQIVGNCVGTYLADKFVSWLVSLFQERPEDGYLRACQELGVKRDAHRKQIKKAYAAFHPDKGSGLSNEEFYKKTIAFELIKAWRNHQNTWDDEDE